MPPKKRRPRPARPEPEPKEPAGDPEQRGKADRHPTRLDPKASGESGPSPDRIV